MRERLAGVLEERALLPLARVTVASRPLAVRDDDAKTVVRLAVERVTVLADGGRRVPLAPRLRLKPVLGYDGAFERAEQAVRETLQPEVPGRPVFDEAVAAAGGRPGGVSSKPRVPLREGMAAGHAAGLVLDRLAEIAEANLAGTLDDLDTEFLHDLRVSIRRSRSVLRELKGVFPPAQLARVRAELRWAQAVTGPVRDLDVQLLEWDELAALVPADRAAGLAPLRRLLDARRRRELAALRRRAAQRAVQGGAGGVARARLRAAGGGRPARRRAGRGGRRRPDPPRVRADGPRRPRDRRRQPGRGAARPAQARQGAALPARVLRRPVSGQGGQADGLRRSRTSRTCSAGSRTGPSRWRRCGRSGEALAQVPGGPEALIALGSLIDALEADQREARAAFEARFAAFASKQERAQVKASFPKAAA